MKSIQTCLAALGLPASQADVLATAEDSVKIEVLVGIANYCIGGHPLTSLTSLISIFAGEICDDARSLSLRKTEEAILQLGAALGVVQQEDLEFEIRKHCSGSHAGTMLRKVFPDYRDYRATASSETCGKLTFVIAPEGSSPSAAFRAYARANAARIARAGGSLVAGALCLDDLIIAEVFDEGDVQVKPPGTAGVREMRRLYAGLPTGDFWTAWETWKEVLKEMGISVRKVGAEWEVAWWRVPDVQNLDPGAVTC